MRQGVSRNFLLLHLHYDIYDTVNPQIYHRVPIADSEDEKTPELPTIVDVVQQDDRLLLFLTSKLGEGSTGVVHGGVLEVETQHRKSRLAIAAKLSFTEDQRERLQNECLVHMHLTEAGVQGIPPILGIFYDPEIAAAPLCLLTCHAGVSLEKVGNLLRPLSVIHF